MAFERWRLLKEKSRQGGGAERVKKQKEGGRLTARERLETFFDPGSFTEIDPFVTHRVDKFGLGERRPPGDGVVTGWGEVVESTLELLESDAGRRALIAACRRSLYGRGRYARIDGRRVGVIQDLGEDGELWIEGAGGREAVWAGDLTIEEES